MTAKTTLALLLFCCVKLSYAQTLQNGDFEVFSDCPQYLGEVELCTGWETVITNADYFNCDFTVKVYPTETGASSGEGCMGMGCYGNLVGAAESIGQSLQEPLVVGQNYSFLIDAKMVTGGPFGQECTGICIYGLPAAPPQGLAFIHAESLEGAVQLACTEDVFNTEWETFSLEFTPDQAFTYLVITPGVAPQCYQYIYIDNIRELPTTSVGEVDAASLTVKNPVRAGETVVVSGMAAEALEFLWYDMSGRLLEMRSDALVPFGLTPGSYLLEVRTLEGKRESYRVIVEG